MAKSTKKASAKKKSKSSKRAGVKSEDENLDKKVKNSDTSIPSDVPESGYSNGESTRAEYRNNGYTSTKGAVPYRQSKYSSQVRKVLRDLKYHNNRKTSDPHHSKSQKRTIKKDKTIDDTVDEVECMEKQVKQMAKQGHSEKSARKIIFAEYEDYHGEGDYPLRLSLSKYRSRSKEKNYDMDDSLSERVRGAVYLAGSMTQTQRIDNYKAQIKKGARVVVLAGHSNVPKNPRVLEEALGEPVIYMSSKDSRKLKEIIDYAKSQGITLELNPFSDGGKVVNEYLDRNTDRDVGSIYGTATKTMDHETEKFVPVHGDRDRLFIAEDTPVDDSARPAKKIYGGHTYFVYNRHTNSQLANIIKSNRVSVQTSDSEAAKITTIQAIKSQEKIDKSYREAA